LEEVPGVNASKSAGSSDAVKIARMLLIGSTSSIRKDKTFLLYLYPILRFF
jgi:hypothetical protein